MCGQHSQHQQSPSAALLFCLLRSILLHLLLLLLLQNGEDQVSCYLFWQYLASLATLPAFMALYLQLLQSGQLAS